MLQRDYIMRLLQEFMAALQRMLEKKEATTRQAEIKKLYEQYVGPYAFYHVCTKTDLLKAVAGIPAEQRRAKTEMLAELYYAEAQWASKPDRDQLLDKAYALFDLLETEGTEFSFDRQTKMDAIRNIRGGEA